MTVDPLTEPLPDPLSSLPASDADVAPWVAALGLPGLVDIHVHFLPERVMAKVWSYFDDAAEHYGMAWPVHYRHDEDRRLAILGDLGVRHFAPLVYPHKPGMAAWLTDWAMDFGHRVPGAVPTATLFPEPEVTGYLAKAIDGGARCVKAHVQVGAFDPVDPLLDPAWGMLADAGVPVVVHCGHGPMRGDHTGLDVFAQVLDRHPQLTAVLAHAGMPEFHAALRLADRYPRVHLDTTMVGTPFSERLYPVPADWTARLVDLADRIVLGSDFPNIPYGYVEQVAAIGSWAGSRDALGVEFLRAVLHDNPARLLGLPPA